MSDRPVTIYDVATVAGVSVFRVRRFLDNPGKLSRTVRRKIGDAMLGLDFHPETTLSDRVNLSYRHIAVITPYSTAYSFRERIRGVSEALPSEEYEVVNYIVETQAQLDHLLTRLAFPGVADGIILMSLPISDEAIGLLKTNGVPLVSVERAFPGTSGISLDNVEGGRLAARYLLKRGFRKPAYMGDAGNPEYAEGAAPLRLKGFGEILDEAGVPLTDERTVFHELGADYVPEAVARLMKSPDPPDCLFFASDLEAIVALKTARDLDLEVPGELAILGFDNIELSDFLGLSTVDQFLEKSGRDAAELLVGQLNGRIKKPETIHYELQIKERWTT